MRNFYYFCKFLRLQSLELILFINKEAIAADRMSSLIFKAFFNKVVGKHCESFGSTEIDASKQHRNPNVYLDMQI